MAQREKKDAEKMLMEKQVQLDSLQKDFQKTQERLRALMSSES